MEISEIAISIRNKYNSCPGCGYKKLRKDKTCTDLDCSTGMREK